MYARARTGSDASRLVAFAMAGLVVIVSYSSPLQRTLFALGDTCALHRATGIKCPACGLTHAVIALLRGHPLGALRINVLAVPILVLIGTAMLGRRWPRSVIFGTMGAGLIYSFLRNA